MPLAKLRGRGRRLEVMLDEDVPFSELQQDLRDISQRIKDRFPGHAVTIGVGRRILNTDDMDRLRNVMEQEYGLEIEEVWCNDDSLEEALEERSGLPVRLVSPRRTGGASPPTQYSPIILRGTCRSGTAIHHKGDVVVLGDVNSGAEVSAAGDVVIYGVLRGRAHAGDDGDFDASILALSFQSTRFKIGPLSGELSARDMGTSPGPQIARVSNGAVIVESYTAAFHPLALA